MNYLGSIESSLYKGNVVLCQAVRKIVTSKFKPKPHPTVLEITDKGIKIVDKTKIIVSKLISSCSQFFFYFVMKEIIQIEVEKSKYSFILGIDNSMP